MAKLEQDTEPPSRPPTPGEESGGQSGKQPREKLGEQPGEEDGFVIETGETGSGTGDKTSDSGKYDEAHLQDLRENLRKILQDLPLNLQKRAQNLQNLPSDLQRSMREIMQSIQNLPSDLQRSMQESVQSIQNLPSDLQRSMQESVQSIQNLPSDLQRSMQDLRERLASYRDAYFHQSTLIVSDAEYDALFRHLEQLEEELQIPAEERFTQRVGAAPQPAYSHHRHLSPMLSLENGFSAESVLEFDKKIKRYLGLPPETTLDYLAEPKIDGVSASLLYQDGKLVRGLSRGDGTTGEDVTQNLRQIPDIPEQLRPPFPALLEIRGEVYLERTQFECLNAHQRAEGLKPFANPRNAASSSMRLLDAELSAKRGLRFFAHGIGGVRTSLSASTPLEELPDATQAELVERLRALGFRLPDAMRLCRHPDEVIDFWKATTEKREKLNYEMDGIVAKLNDRGLQGRLGIVQRSPRWALAVKFPAQEVATRVQNIVVHVGRTGVVTPVAELEEVTIGQVQVRRASLHNADEIERLAIQPGARVLVKRAGDVIPKIVAVLEQGEGAFHFPDHCPACGAPLVRQEAVYRCPDRAGCQGQRLESLRYFVSRQGLDIDGLGQEALQAFFEWGWVRTYADLFRLPQHREELAQKKGWGALSIQNLCESLEARRSVGLTRVITALGMPTVGPTLAAQLASFLGSWETFTKLLSDFSPETDIWKNLLALDGIGARTLEEIAAFAHHKGPEVLELGQLLTITHETQTREQSSALTGKSMAFTGTLSRMTRQEAKELVKRLGVRVMDIVSQKTDYLVCGKSTGTATTKAKKAAAMGVSVLSEEDFLAILDRPPGDETPGGETPDGENEKHAGP